MRGLKHIKENLGAVGWQMANEDVEWLRANFPGQQNISPSCQLSWSPVILKILLVKRGGKWLEKGKWALPGGFLDMNETLEQAVLRELKEETGYTGKVIKLFQIVDNPRRRHEDRQNVALVYLVKPLKKVGGPDHEISEIKWFDLNKLPPKKQIAFDHLEMIKLYIKGL